MAYEWIERFKNGRTSTKHEEGARRVSFLNFLIHLQTIRCDTTLLPYCTDILLCISARKKTDHCPLLFFGANEKWAIQVYDTKLMTGMDFQGHICTTTVGDK
jgi:hypothetical protein